MKKKTEALPCIKTSFRGTITSLSQRLKGNVIKISVGAILGLCSVTGYGQVLNGSFEANTTPTSPLGSEFITYTTASSPGITNWTVLNTVELHNRLHRGMGCPPPAGNQNHVDLNQTGGIRQSIALLSGRSYVLTFWTSVHDLVTCTGGATAKVSVVGVSPTTTFLTSTISVTPADRGVWTKRRFVFTAPPTSSTVNLNFEGLTSCIGGTGGVLIDSIALKDTLIVPPTAECSDTCYWKVTGNNIIGGRNIFGTLSNDDVKLYTNNSPIGIFTKNGYLGWGNTTPTAKFHVDITGQPFLQGVRFEGLIDGQDDKVLCVDNDGNVHRRPYLNFPPGSKNNCNNLGFIPKTIATVSGDMDCSQIFDDGKTVGINKTSGFVYGGGGIELASSGFTGILALDVNGVIRGDEVVATSDRKFKTNIKTIDNSLGKILSLNSVEYNWRVQEFPYKRFDNLKHTGFIAQELEKVLPHSVIIDEKGDYAVDYFSIIPVLTQAIQEQQKQIEELKALIQNKPSSTNTNSDVINKDGHLNQNVPNPFSVSTFIKYELPKGAQKAVIGIYDMNGKEVKLFTLPSEKNGSVIIQGGDLIPGMYLYTLVIDGEYFDSKKMILTSQ
jgi:hypothetical protein